LALPSFPTRRSSDLVGRRSSRSPVADRDVEELVRDRRIPARVAQFDFGALVAHIHEGSLATGAYIDADDPLVRRLPAGLDRDREDRKSTRLNSSHVA